MTPILIIVHFSFANVANHTRGNAGDDREARNVARNNRARANQRAFTDRDAREDCRAATDARASSDNRLNNFPVSLRLRRAIGVHRTRIDVVRKHHTMTDKTFILNRDAFTDETMRRDLTTFTDLRVLLYLNKRADLRVRADRTAVEIDQVGLKDANAGTDDYVRCYRHYVSNAVALEQTRQRIEHPALRPAHVWFANRVKPPALIIEEASLVAQIFNCPASNILSHVQRSLVEL